MVSFETERLLIRDNLESDISMHHKLMSDLEVMRYIQDIMTITLEESKKNLEFSIEESKKEDRKCFFFAMLEKDTGNFVGAIGFTIIEKTNDHGIAEMGYFALKDYWGKGYVTEAARSVVRFAFEEVRLHKMLAGCNALNTKSENIMKKLGMSKEAHHKQQMLFEDTWCDRLIYAKLRDEA